MIIKKIPAYDYPGVVNHKNHLIQHKRKYDVFFHKGFMVFVIL